MAPPDAQDGLVATLVDQHGQGLRAYFRRATRSVDTADDLVQEVFLRVAGARATYEPRGRDRAWLFTIAHNVLVQHLRRQSRDPVETAAPREPSVAAQQDLGAALEQALQQLDEADRQAFLLVELGGLTYAETAIACGMTHAAVRSRIFRVRLALRERLPAPSPLPTVPPRSTSDDDR